MPDTISPSQSVTPKYQALIDMVSHELKSPLTTIKIFAEVLQKETGASFPDANIKYLKKIDTKINQLTGLINDYSDIVKITNRQMVFQDAVFSFTDLLSTVLLNIQKQQPFNYKTDNAADCRLFIDPEKFQLALAKFIFHLRNRLSADYDNLQIISGLENGRLIINILNPTRSIPIREYQLVIPNQTVDFYDDIEVTLADAILKHYSASSQLFRHPDFGYAFTLSFSPQV